MTRCKWKRTVFVAVCAVGGAASGGALMVLGGCNTTEGVGEDIEAAGDAIDDAAEDANG